MFVNSFHISVGGRPQLFCLAKDAKGIFSIKNLHRNCRLEQTQRTNFILQCLDPVSSFHFGFLCEDLRHCLYSDMESLSNSPPSRYITSVGRGDKHGFYLIEWQANPLKAYANSNRFNIGNVSKKSQQLEIIHRSETKTKNF